MNEVFVQTNNFSNTQKEIALSLQGACLALNAEVSGSVSKIADVTTHERKTRLQCRLEAGATADNRQVCASLFGTLQQVGQEPMEAQGPL